MENVILFGALGVMIVFMFMNNKKRKKQADDLQASIAVGSYVMLTSGIYGTVTAFEDDKVVLESAGSKMLVNKLAIRQVETKKPAAAKAPAAKKPAAKSSAKTSTAAAKKPAAKKTTK